MRRRAWRAWAVLGLSLLLTACAGGGNNADQASTPSVPNTLTVSSQAIPDGGPLPTRFTCDGTGTSPPLSWHGAPADAQVFALVVDDPDAPGGTYYHWLVVDIPSGTTSVAAGATPAGGVPGENSAGSTGFTPPCPPSGTHHYRFTVYALSEPTGLTQGFGIDDGLAAITGAAIARGRLVARYSHHNG